MFNNYYVKVAKSSTATGYKIPLSKMAIDTLSIKPKVVQDLDPYTDANGELHRNPLSHTSASISFSTPVMEQNEFLDFMGTLRTHCANELKRDYYVTYFNHETNSYDGPVKCYMVEPEFKPMLKNGSGKIIINQTPIEFIKY